MSILEKAYRVNEQGMIVEEINEIEIDDVIRSIQEIDRKIEKLVSEKKSRSPIPIHLLKIKAK